MNDRDENRVAKELDAFLTSRLSGQQSSPPTDADMSATLVDLALAIRPDPDFATSLEARLSCAVACPPFLLACLRQITFIVRRQMMHKRIVFALTGAAVLVLLGLFGPALFGWLQGPTPVSAAEILDRTNARLAAQATGAEVLYDRLLIDWHGLTTQRDVLAELWQSLDGEQLRYQLTSAEGDVLYFVQRDGDRLWRSVHARPIGLEAVTRVYEMSLDQYQAESVPDPSPWELFHSDLSVGWVEIDRVIMQRQGACADLYCLFGVAGGAWECDAEGCTLNVEGDSIVRARLVGEEKLDDGRRVQVVELAMGDGWTRTLRVDSDSFALVEVVDRERGNFVASLRHLERQALSGPDWPADLFSTIPGDLRVVQAGQPGAGPDRLWVISATPEPGVELTAQTEFEVVIGYELASVPEAVLQVNLARPGFENINTQDRLPVIKGTDFVEITAGAGQVAVRFSVNLAEEQWLDPGDMALFVMLGTWKGATRLNILAAETFTEYQWYIEP